MRMKPLSFPIDGDVLSLLACTMCGGALASDDAGLHCPADGGSFPIHPSGLLDLRLPDARLAADAFAARYAAARLADGWKPLTPETACVLPSGNPAGFTRLYWTVRRESWAALAALVTQFAPPPLLIADLGAGFPWLSHRLASLGHCVVAIDLSADADFGLGAARLYPTAACIGGHSANHSGASLRPGQFLPVLGDLARPPLAPGAYDIVICNASLHYVDNLPAAVARMAGALRPGGAFVLLDSPVADAPRPGNRPGGRVLGRAELGDALNAAGLAATWPPVRRGCLWQRHQLKDRLLRRPTFDFPLVLGKPALGRASARVNLSADR
jgi:SAM-dependent methyltransferase